MDTSNGFHSMMYALWEMLDKVDMNVNGISMNAIKLGKLIKRQKLKSKHTLDQKEIRYYTLGLVEIYKNWGRYGHKDWKVSEREMSSIFTVYFERKDGV